METLTNQIKDELLNAAGDPCGLEAVVDKYKGSKGPFYGALAQATVALKVQLEVVTGKVKEAEKSVAEIEDKFENTQCQVILFEQSRDKLHKELSSLEANLKDKKSLLAQAEALGGLGFDAEQLSKLHQRLAKLAASQGVKPAEMTKLFFDEVSKYEDIVGLDNEAQRAGVAAKKANAEMAKAQAEARAAEAESRARKVSIGITEKLLALGMKESDLPIWNNILTKSGVSVGELAQAIEQFGSIDKACKDRGKRNEALETETRKLLAQVSALNEEGDQVSAAIGAVREKAVSEVERISKKTMENLDKLLKVTAKYGDLERQAAKLENELALARAFTSQDSKQWELVPLMAIRELLAGLIVWSSTDVANNPVLCAPPKSISSQAMFYSFGTIRLGDVLSWGLSGLHSYEEKRAVAVRK